MRATGGSLAEVLAAGTGLVQLHRGSVPTATQLWITPGVREWVDGAAVSCGETLELLSTPQMSGAFLAHCFRRFSLS